MSQALRIALKELRGLFGSPVAFIFLAVYLLVSLYLFFWHPGYFTRNMADVRPLFAGLPVMLIFLTSALTMRLWSEEQKQGTMEVLLTLPVRDIHLVLGKFLAAWAMVGLALLCTLGLPLSVDRMGPLDWGPVWGGYCAALLLAAAYVSIGLCVSVTTENQIISLIVSVLAGFLLYIPSQEGVAETLGSLIAGLLEPFGIDKAALTQNAAAFIRSLGTGDRFHAIEKGLIDSRDLCYLVGLSVFFITVNAALVAAKRQCPPGSPGESRRTLGVILVGLNLALMSLWMAPRPLFRLDLTEHGDYTLSEATRDLLGSLSEDVTLTLILNEDTLPFLKPLQSQLVDLADEFALVSHGRLRVVELDPTHDSAVAEKLESRYGIKAESGQNKQKYKLEFKSVYFHVLVQHADRHEILGPDKLLEARMDPARSEPDYRLKNPEYILTKTIKKLVHDFESLDSAFSRLSGDAKLKTWVSLTKLREMSEDREAIERLLASAQKVGTEITQKSDGRFSYVTEDPAQTGLGSLELLRTHGVRSLGIPGLYLDLILEVDGKKERIPWNLDTSESLLRESVEAALRRHLPGFSKTVGIWTRAPAAPADPENPYAPPPPSEISLLTEVLGQEFTVKPVGNLMKSGAVPEVDALVVVGLAEVTERELWAFDQYVMSGRPVTIFQGYADVQMGGQKGVELKPVKFGLEDLLFGYGVQVRYTLAQDELCREFIDLENRKIIPYPSFIDVREPRLSGTGPTAGLDGLLMTWCSPVRFDRRKPFKVEVLARTGEHAWIADTQSVENAYASGAWSTADLAVSIQGPLESHFKGKVSPMAEVLGAVTRDRVAARLDDTSKAKLAVIGSHAMVQDMVQELCQTLTYRVGIAGLDEQAAANLGFALNLVSWGIEDEGLGRIRSRSSFARTLRPMDEAEKKGYERLNYIMALFFLAGVLGTAFVMNKYRRPLVGPGSES